MSEKLMNTKEAANFLSVQEQTLIIWRHQGRGPTYIKVGGSIKYAASDLRNYLKLNRVRPEARKGN